MHDRFAAVGSSAIVVDPKACLTHYYMKAFFQIVVPRSGNKTFIYCTHDVELYADYAANGFCNMTSHSPADVFSSPAWYDCPNLNPDAAIFSKAVLLLMAWIALPCVTGVAFLLGAGFVGWKMRMDTLAQTKLYPVGVFQRAMLVFGMGLAAALLSIPWMLQWLGAITWLTIAVFLKGVFGFHVFCGLRVGTFDFWRPFMPLGRKIRARMGGRERLGDFDERWQGFDPSVWQEEFLGKEMQPYKPTEMMSIEDLGDEKTIVIEVLGDDKTLVAEELVDKKRSITRSNTF
ncbi:hypothetical protein MGG_01910 [Pyricularia oryzae 70-15]|uniref:Uncharacterized protein n=1 Tax=Pyricularia oryzae (strain 70-15 / ATCC MYA-4617 / FGSC 8958) TaxID=242507 RepID=G4NG25_PYRO7|nr:uncharacterized protein MGG_01910 [Pyricularia oryzae 70-15]EHA46982.1 hypothetical protein MGG_01910 [Pyricularia oryzae 70-15]